MPRLGLGRGLDTMERQFAPIFGTISRNFTTFVAAGSKRVTFASKSLTDFEVEILVNPTTNRSHIWADTASSTDRIFHEASSNKIAVGNPATTVEFTGTIPLNELSTLSIKRLSNVWSALLNGVSLTVAAGQGNSSAFSINSIGSPFGAGTSVPYFDGILADAKIWTGGDRITGTLSRFYKVDETWDGPSTVAVDSGSDGSNGTAVNITPPDSENFNFDGSVSPNTWTNDAETRVIEVAGT